MKSLKNYASEAVYVAVNAFRLYSFNPNDFSEEIRNLLPVLWFNIIYKYHWTECFNYLRADVSWKEFEHLSIMHSWTGNPFPCLYRRLKDKRRKPYFTAIAFMICTVEDLKKYGISLRKYYLKALFSIACNKVDPIIIRKTYFYIIDCRSESFRYVLMSYFTRCIYMANNTKAIEFIESFYEKKKDMLYPSCNPQIIKELLANEFIYYSAEKGY